ncbi:MAG: metallophosphoesterase family protein [Myxococcales bacterium]|nr:metallophosphoesterase family protein [Myxococcales bacterium]MDD9970373.1 metallophosphoesterase family protein [Myxococcales bacterium]
MLTRLGIIGDVHAETGFLQRALEHLQGLEVERLLCVGDIVDGPGDGYDVDECCALLKEHNVLTVCGNHDRWLLENTMRDLEGATDYDDLAPESLAYLQRLPTTAELDTSVGKLLLCHGVGENDMATVYPYDHGYALSSNEALQSLRRSHYRIAIGGHTHLRMVRRFDPITFINAGTLHREFTPCFGYLDLASGSIDFFSPTGERIERHALTGQDA